MKPIKYIKGNNDRAEEIKKAFLNLGALNIGHNFDRDGLLYYMKNNYINIIDIDHPLSQLLIEHGEEIKLPEKKELPKTWEEWVEMNPVVNGEFYIDSMAKICYQQYSERLTKRDCINLSSSEDAEGLLALIKLKRLRDCYNDGWKPDFNLKNDKFCIRYYKDDIIDTTICQHNKHFLAFRTKELRDEFLNNFRDLIEEAKMWL